MRVLAGHEFERLENFSAVAHQLRTRSTNEIEEIEEEEEGRGEREGERDAGERE